jgi:arginine decarboxylase
MLATPKRYSLVAASAEGERTLTAFDQALLKSGVGNVNLVKVSSILPPEAEYVSELVIPPGSLLPIAYGSIVCSEPGELVAAAVAVGIGTQGQFGVIMEFSGHCTREHAENEVRAMVREAFQYRGMELSEVKSIGVEHKVSKHGCAFAAVPLWY